MTKSKSKIWGIYEIRNLVNNKVYIGSSINVKARLYEHSRLLNIGKHENKHLQRAWNKYGKDNFKFQILEKICFKKQKSFTVRNLRDLETNYILKANSADSDYGYNIIPGGVGTLNLKISEERRKKISESNKGKKAWNKNIPMKRGQRDLLKKIKTDLYGKKIDVYTVDFKFIETILSVRECSRKYHCGRNTIVDSCRGLTLPKLHVFVYHGDNPKDIIGKNRVIKERSQINYRERHGKAIDVFDSLGNYIETLPSVIDVSEKYNCADHTVTDIAKGKANPTHVSYIFRYSNDDSEVNYSYKGNVFMNSKYVVRDNSQEIIYETRSKYSLMDFISTKYSRVKSTVLNKLKTCTHENNEFKIKELTVKLEKLILRP